MTTVRSFLALPLSTDVRTRIAEVQSSLKLASADVKWDTPEKFHITLLFLGNAEAALLETLTKNLAQQLQQLSSFELIYEGVGAFPSAEHPRVLWTGTRPSESLMQLHRVVESACATLGIPNEEKTFNAHVTLGRVKGTKNVQRLTEGLKNITLQPIQSRCWGVQLVRSELTPAGSIYTTLQSFLFTP